MKQQQIQVQGMRQRPILEEDCDLGVEPLAGTSIELDFVMDESGRVHPAVVLSLGTERRAFVLDDLRVKSKIARRLWQEQAKIYFAQEDPTTPQVFILVLFRGKHFEYPLKVDDLLPFMDFPYELSVGKGFADDHEMIKGADVL